MTQYKLAIIATSQAQMGHNGQPTGVWLEEVTTPYYSFRDAGVEVDLYSIAGGDIPIDPKSMRAAGENDPSVERYLSDAEGMQCFRKTHPVTEVDIQAYDAVFFPGGHGTMWDYPDNDAVAELVGAAIRDGKVVGAVCHGPAALISAKSAGGAALVAGKRLTGFTNTEESAAGLTDSVPFLLEDRLRALGADFSSGPDFRPFALRDGLLVTGQNPASAEVTAALVLEALEARRAAQTTGTS